MTTMNPPCRPPLPDSQPLATSEPIELFINKLEVGRRTGMRPRTIDAWMKRGLLPYYKLGRSVRFKWSEVEAHLASKCRVARRQRGGWA
jgi:excisionase family DNA binding protein